MFLKTFAEKEKKADEPSGKLAREFRENVSRVSLTIDKLRAAGREMAVEEVGRDFDKMADKIHNAVVDILVTVKRLEQY